MGALSNEHFRTGNEAFALVVPYVTKSCSCSAHALGLMAIILSTLQLLVP